MIVVRKNGWVATDAGGPYIDIGRGIHEAVDCVNVWDYERGARDEHCPYTKSFVRLVLEDWIIEFGQDYERNGY